MTLPKTYSPFFVGFDSIFDKMNEFTKQMPTGFPPYNIRKIDDNKYVIELAVAGFAKSDLEIELDGDVLKISGKATEDTEGYLYKGISARNFVRTFNIADNVEIKDAMLVNGMLKVFLDAITTSKTVKKIEVKDEVA